MEYWNGAIILHDPSCVSEPSVVFVIRFGCLAFRNAPIAIEKDRPTPSIAHSPRGVHAKLALLRTCVQRVAMDS